MGAVEPIADRGPADLEEALAADPESRLARRDLAVALVRAGRLEESIDLWRHELSSEGGFEWASDVMMEAMEEADLSFAGGCAEILTRLRWGPSRHLDGEVNGEVEGVDQPTAYLTRGKLGHDIDQLVYLRDRKVLGDEVDEVIASYEAVLASLDPDSPDTRQELGAEAREKIGDVYNRVLHVRETPAVDRALSDSWDPQSVESEYLDNPPGVVVIDDVLTPECLRELREFCLESTVWSGNRYRHGRLGAFFESGFNCPLLLQVAEEFRDALPGLIGERYPLRQLWGFKSGPTLPADSTVHADFAAVNVNLWITPAAANLDESSGGLVVYEVNAPLDWGFDMYNSRPDLIHAFLHRHQARRRRIPYRENRALIFNSDLFHATEEVRFRPGYENRRINVTMLYGNREQQAADRVTSATGGALRPPWRSAVFASKRRRRS